jgi:hypothetical protein
MSGEDARAGDTQPWIWLPKKPQVLPQADLKARP